MAFDFSEEQQAFRHEVQKFVHSEVTPGAKERVKLDFIPKEYWGRLAEAGLLGISIPTEYGGQGGDVVLTGIAIEEIAKKDISMGILVLLPTVGYFALQTAQESRRLLEEWVPKAVRGEATCCFALTEPDAGADAAGIKTKAVRERDFYVLNGEKTSITMGYDADHGIIFAKTNPAAGIRGITCFWVPLDLPGVAKSRLLHSGMKGVGACSVIFEDVRVPVTNRCGEEGKGFYIFGDIVNYQRCWVALSALGAAQGALEETIGYVLQRTAFGHPLVRFEGVAFNIVEHATRIEAARLLCYRTLSMAAQGKSPVKEAAMCKWWCPEIAFEAVHDCLLLHGHIGYSEEYPLEQRLRDVLGLEFMDSVSQIMKMIAVRQMMGREAASL